MIGFSSRMGSTLIRLALFVFDVVVVVDCSIMLLGRLASRADELTRKLAERVNGVAVDVLVGCSLSLEKEEDSNLALLFI